MSSRSVISAILNLDDRFSKKLQKVNENIKTTKKQIEQSQKAIAELNKKIQTREEISKLAEKAERTRATQNNRTYKAEIAAQKTAIENAREELKVYKEQTKELKKKSSASKGSSSIASGVVKGLAKYKIGSKAIQLVADTAKTAVTAASSLETLRANLDVVTKSPTKSASVLKNAVKLAQSSSFTNDEMAGAAATLETYGLSSESYLKTVGDASAITGRDIGDLAKAFGKAVTGNQWDTFYDYGITRDKVEKYALEKGYGKLFNGSKVKSEETLAKVLAAYMNETYAGGMGKQANTLSGLWSTTKGLGTSALAQIMGVSTGGEIKAGSALEEIKNIVQGFRNRMEKWTENGTFEKIGNSVGSIVSSIGKLLELVSPAIEKIAPLLESVLGWIDGLLGKAISPVERADKKAVYLVVEGDMIRAGEHSAVDYERRLKQMMEENGLEYNRAENALYGSLWFPDYEYDAAYASGTSYTPGGMALVGERGPELVNLPRGAAVTRADETRSILNRGNTFYMTFHVNGESGRAIAEEVAGYIMEALDNV